MPALSSRSEVVEWRVRMEGAERNEAAARAVVGLTGVLHRNREINFLCDKCVLAGYTCQMWQEFSEGRGWRKANTTAREPPPGASGYPL